MAKTLTNEELKQFEKLSKPLVDFIRNHAYPYGEIIITIDSATLLSGEARVPHNDKEHLDEKPMTKEDWEDWRHHLR